MALSLDGTTGITSDGGTPVIENLDTTATGIDVTGVLTTTGNVGIGYSNPQELVHLYKTGGSTIRFQNPGQRVWSIGNDGTSFVIDDVTGASERMRIDTSGNVGIGNTSPTQKLDVTGTVKATAFSGDGSSLTGIESLPSAISVNGSAPTGALTINADGDVLPASNGTQDFGSSSVRWANIYTSDLHLSNGIGNYTIVEGEEDLFLYNNKSGKTYKFMLAEVDPSEAPKKMEK